VLSPTPAEPVSAVWAEFESVRFVGVTVIVPVVVTVPGEYVAAVAGMVFVPLAKLVSETVTVQLAAAKARASVTVDGPIAALIWVPGAPEPRVADAGTLRVSAPDVTVKETVVLGSLADAWGADTTTTPATITAVATTGRILMSPPKRFRAGFERTLTR
jgi:hypothetical protein